MSLDAEWSRCAPWLQAALDAAPPTHRLSDVREMVDRGEAQFWPFQRSAMVSLIWTEPLAKTLHHWLVGGDLHDLMSHRAEVETWAEMQGCTRLFTAGRRGWEKTMAHHGYHIVGSALAKEL